jgi:hypothetical protein
LKRGPWLITRRDDPSEVRLNAVVKRKKIMKKSRRNKRVRPQRERAAPLRTSLAAILAVVLVTSLLSFPGSLAQQAGENQGTSTQMKQAEIQESDALSAFAAGDKGRQIKWQILGSGGNAIAGKVNYLAAVMYGTVGQTAVGPGSSPSYDMNSGFWQSFLQGFLRGDANADGTIDLGDVVYLVNYLYKVGPAPIPMEAGNANCDEGIEVEDIVYLVNYLLRNGPVPSC